MSGISPGELRRVFGTFATGVTVVCYEVDGVARGATVNSFTSVSLEPALVLVSLDRRSKAAAALTGRPFTVNVLSAEQRDVALHFAGVPQRTMGDPFEPVTSSVVAPALLGALSCISCRPWAVHEAGDHQLFVGEVVDVRHPEDSTASRPLGFFGGRFCRIEHGERGWAADSELLAAMQQDLSFSW